LCATEDIDLIHVHDAHAHSLVIYAAVLARLSVPAILSRRVDFPIKNTVFSRFKYNHPVVKKIICVSKAIEQILSPDIRNPERLSVIHSGIDLERFSRVSGSNPLRSTYAIPADHWLIGNTSALADHKDYFTFVDTAAILLEQGMKAFFVIIGDGPERATIEQYIRQKGLESYFLITGFREDVARLLPELDIYLMTSKTEGLGTSVLEAFAAGVPVVATRAGGIPEMITNGENGLLADVGDAAGLSHWVRKLADEASLSQKLARKAQEQVKAFSKENMAHSTYAVYADAIAADTP